MVSTHSRLKAAGQARTVCLLARRSFNTQPPEGGWVSVLKEVHELTGFNTQPPEGGWHQCGSGLFGWPPVSTHSRPKAAGDDIKAYFRRIVVSTHSRPKAAGQVLGVDGADGFMFQHTAARRRLALHFWVAAKSLLFQHTAARRRLALKYKREIYIEEFQHTAARRRLVGG